MLLLSRNLGSDFLLPGLVWRSPRLALEPVGLELCVSQLPLEQNMTSTAYSEKKLFLLTVEMILSK